MRRLNPWPWWKERRSSVRCGGDEAVVAIARAWKGVWTVEGME